MTYNPHAWETLPPNWNNNAEGWPKHRLDVLEVIQPLFPEINSILEVACCTGHYIRRLRKIGYEGRYLGIDITPRFIKEAKILSPEEYFLVRDGRTISEILWGRKDLILAPGILMHLSLKDSRKALRKWLNLSNCYVLLSYFSGPETREIFDGKFYNNLIDRNSIQAVLNENERIIVYNLVGRFATCLVEKIDGSLHPQRPEDRV